MVIDNGDFAEYVTSSAFRLDLSKRMCQALAYTFVNYHGEVRTWCNIQQAYVFSLKCPFINLMRDAGIHTLSAIARRGLIAWRQDHTGENYKIECTDAGVITLQLVQMAGVLPHGYDEAIDRKRQWMIDTEEERQAALARQVLRGAESGQSTQAN